jgi:ribosomal protein S18 acetylase RimI-like enzyme
MTLLNIRNAGADDAHAIATIQVDASRAAYAAIVPHGYLERLTVEKRTAVWTQLISANGEFEQTIVGEDGERIQAYAHYGRSRDPNAAQTTGELYSLYVAPDRWRCGLGQQLLAASIRRLASMGFDTATLWVLAANTPARQFYERFRWAPDGTEKGDEEQIETRYRIDLSAQL